MLGVNGGGIRKSSSDEVDTRFDGGGSGVVF